MPFYRKNNLNLFLFFSLITYLSLTFANIENTIEIKQIELENDEDKIIINIEEISTLSPKIIELLERGIPIAFNLKIELIKENTFWFDKVINQNKIFEDEQVAIKNLLSNKVIIIKKNNHQNNAKLKIWVELDKKKLPKAIQADILNKSWEAGSNIIIYDMNKL